MERALNMLIGFLMCIIIAIAVYVGITVITQASALGQSNIKVIEDDEAVERFYHDLYKSVDTVYMHMSDTVVVATIHETSNGLFLLNVGRHGGVYYNKTSIFEDIRKIMRVGVDSFYYIKED